MKKNRINLFFICIPLIFIVVLVFKIQGFKDFMQQISRIKQAWMSLSILLMVCYWVFEAFSVYLIAHFHHVKLKYKDSFLITMVGQFFNAITPFSAGGQPAQIMKLVKNGIEMGDASSIVMIKFAVYQSVFSVYSLTATLFAYTFFNKRIPLLLPMIVLGLSVHIILIFLSLLFYSRISTTINVFIVEVFYLNFSVLASKN